MEDKEENIKFNCSVPINEKQDESENKNIHEKNLTDLERLGKYQLIVYIVISFPLILSAGFALGYVFTSGDVDYRCVIPECDEEILIFNTTWSKYSSPAQGNFGSCEYFTSKKSDGAVKKLECTMESFTNKTARCNNWVYDPQEKTILSEWDITCNENRWKLTLVGTINNLGQLVGLMFAGYLSDRYGRRTLLVSQTFLTGIVGIVQSFSVNYFMFIIFEFMQSVTSAGIYSTGFILILEIAGEKRRVLSGTIMCCVYALGEMLLGLTAMGLKSWRNIIRVFFAPGLLAIFLPLIIPESIRWLVAKKKYSKVEDIYKKIAKVNGLNWNSIEMSVYRQLNSDNPQEKKSELTKNSSSVLEALSRPKLLIRLVGCCFCWLTNTFVYYGLSLNSVAFAGDKYVNFILVSFVEIPAYFLSWVLIDHVGRKRTLSSSFLLSGLFCLCIQFVPKDSWSYAPIILYMTGKGCITMAFAAVYVYTAEMFPTTARHFLLSICSMTGRIGSILAPQTRLLAVIIESLPLILFGSMGLTAGIISLIFPETLGCKLPDTIEEAENIGRKFDKKTVRIK